MKLHAITQQTTHTYRDVPNGRVRHEYETELTCSCGYHTSTSHWDMESNVHEKVWVVEFILAAVQSHRVLVLCEELGLRFPITTHPMITVKGERL